MRNSRGTRSLALGGGAILLLAMCAVAAPRSGDRRGKDRVDTKSTELIAKYTTDPSFLTSWVDYLPSSSRVPSPLQHLGYAIGAPDKLTQPEAINDYFRALAKASPRVSVFSIGRSDGGREIIVAAIAEPATLGRLENIKRAHRALADPATTDETTAAKLARTTPPIYWITAGLHSPETGPPEMVMELAYRLAVSELDHIREIRKGVVTLITPVLEMDGRARMVDWYNRYLTKVTDLEDSPPKMAPYWGDYTLHDNNRDGLQMSQPLTRAFTEAFHDYMPVGTLDLHESVPLLYVSTGTGPYNDTIDPIAITEWQWIASYEVSQCTKLGLRGVWTWGFYTGWYPGYLLWVANNHNSIGRFYETFGNGHPGTFERELHDSSFAKQRTNSRQWYRPWPPERKLTWSLRNNTNYMQTGVLASLQLFARNGEELLYNLWKKNRNAIERGAKNAPHGFVIPAKQRDKGALHQLLWLLSRHRIDVHRADAAAKLRGGIDIAGGDYIVRLDQRYGNFARTLLYKQHFPKSASHTPYDDVAWSLDYMLGVDIRKIDDPAVFSIAMTPLTSMPVLSGEAAEGSRWIVDHRAQRGLGTLVWKLPETARVRALSQEWDGHPAGSLVIDQVQRAGLAPAATAARVDAVALAGEPPADKLIDLDRPRVAVFHTWVYTQDSGWARYTFEQLGIPFDLINKDQLRAGKLRDKYDVIVIPNQGSLAFRDMVHGIDKRWGPMPYTTTPDYPSHGTPDSSEDITGGMGFEGLSNLESFAAGGGTIVALGSAGRLIADGGLARKVSAKDGSGTPGSHIVAKVVRKDHPIGWGYPEVTHLFRGNLPVYDVPDYWRAMAVVQFGTRSWAQAQRAADRKAEITVPDDKPDAQTAPKSSSNKLVLSGLVKKPQSIERKPAVIDAPIGAGRAVLTSFNPMHRYQNHHDFGFVVNALLFWNDFPAVPAGKQHR